jgi:hypothetical protein
MPRFNEENETTYHRTNSNDEDESYHANTSGSGKKKRSVKFDRVEIRTYVVILGDNPGGQAGAPLSLSWEYHVLGHLPVEIFEKERVDERRQGQKELWLGTNRRQCILSKAGYTASEINQAEKDAQLIRHQRRSSYFKSVLQRNPSWRPKKVKIQHEQQHSKDCSQPLAYLN